MLHPFGKVTLHSSPSPLMRVFLCDVTFWDDIVELSFLVEQTTMACCINSLELANTIIQSHKQKGVQVRVCLVLYSTGSHIVTICISQIGKIYPIPIHSDVTLGVCVFSDHYNSPLMSSFGEGISLEGGLSSPFG